MKDNTLSTSALAIGSTSVLALVAAADQVEAQEFYAGVSVGAPHGDTPSHYSDEDYALGGLVAGWFVGVQQDMGGFFAGLELAYAHTTEGDADSQSSYEYAYDVNQTIDVKLRAGRNLGGYDVYGFGGYSWGDVEHAYYQADYKFNGFNIGAGIQTDIGSKMFLGAEYIHRFTSGVYDRGENYSSDHGVLSLRAGYKF